MSNFLSSAVAASIVSLLAASPSQAEQFGSYGQIEPWSGAYAGANIGVTARKMPNVFKGNSFSGGVQAGYNKQFGAFVVGAEVDGGNAGGQRLSREHSITQDWNVAAKAKAGVALDQTLIYGTMGYGLTKVRANGRSDWNEAKIVGLGAEQMLSGATSVKVEYNRSVLDDVNVVPLQNLKLRSHSVKAGLNVRF